MRHQSYLTLEKVCSYCSDSVKRYRNGVLSVSVVLQLQKCQQTLCLSNFYQGLGFFSCLLQWNQFTVYCLSIQTTDFMWKSLYIVFKVTF